MIRLAGRRRRRRPPPPTRWLVIVLEKTEKVLRRLLERPHGRPMWFEAQLPETAEEDNNTEVSMMMKRFLMLALVLATAGACSDSPQGVLGLEQPSIEGLWSASYDAAALTVVLKERDGAITGTGLNGYGGNFPVAGTFAEPNVTLTFRLPNEGAYWTLEGELGAEAMVVRSEVAGVTLTFVRP